MLVNLPNIIPPFKIAHLLRVTAQMALLLGALSQSATAAAAGGQSPGSSAQASAAQEFESRAANIDRLFAAAAAKGGSFVVRYDLADHSVSRGYGHLDCARTQPMPSDALMDSGSLTKAFTYAAIYKLIEEGRLKLDDRLDSFFAGVPRDKSVITVAQLLDHQAGLHDFVEPTGSVPRTDPQVIVTDYLPMSKQQMLNAAFASELRFSPGMKEEYSNLGYQLLAAIIERASDTDYESYVRENILLPAGMQNTGYRLPDFSGKPFAEQCKGDETWGDPVTKGLWKNGVSWNLIGAGGMMTSLSDLKRWTEAMTSGILFRPDIQSRFRQSRLFMADYQRCRTELVGLAGSNGLTWTGYLYMPLRKETLILASTRSDHKPAEMEVLRLLCPK